MITYNEIIEETKTILQYVTNFNQTKNTTCKMKKIICFTSLLITIALLIVNSINCYLVKYRNKRQIKTIYIILY